MQTTDIFIKPSCNHILHVFEIVVDIKVKVVTSNNGQESEQAKTKEDNCRVPTGVSVSCLEVFNDGFNKINGYNCR